MRTSNAHANVESLKADSRSSAEVSTGSELGNSNHIVASVRTISVEGVGTVLFSEDNGTGTEC